MSGFRYVRAKDAANLTSILADEGDRARIVAGGTDIMVEHRFGRLAPCLLVDISRIDDLRYIRHDGGAVKIGAATTFTDLLRDRTHAPILAEASRTVGGLQVRNMGTVGGNLANASPAGDLIPPLYVLEAKVVLRSAAGRREVPIDRFFTGPGRTVRRPDEFVEEISFDAVPPEAPHFFTKLGPRNAQAISIVSVAFQAGRVAVGACGPTVVRARGVEEALAAGRPLGEAARRVIESISPIDDVRGSAEYRRAMAVGLLHAGLSECPSR